MPQTKSKSDPQKTNPVIEIKGLNKSFNKQVVLKDFSMNLNEGENLVVLGKSGSGKSVLIKCIVGLIAADSGSIKVFGEDITKLDTESLNKIRQKIGFLFQSGALYDSMTVQQNLEFPLRRIKKNLDEKEINQKIQEVLEHVGLADSLLKMPSQLSGGMKKRISLARTLIIDPSILLYDEPTTGLDPATSDEISTLILNVQKQYKTSSMIITHDINCAIKTANRIIMLNNGNIHTEGSTEFFTQSKDPLISSFFS